MKFDRYYRAARRPVITGRRLAAARRSLRKQADAVALFPELQPTETPEQRIARLHDEFLVGYQKRRDYEAQCWREARAQFRGMSPEFRALVTERFWGNRFMPKTAVYLLESIRAVSKEAQP